MKQLLGITCAEEEIPVAALTPNGNIWELRIPLRFSQKKSLNAKLSHDFTSG